MKVTVIPIVIDALDTVTKGLVQGVEGLEISGDHPNYSIVEIGQNTEKSPGDLRRFAVTHSSGKPSVNAGVKNYRKSKIAGTVYKLLVVDKNTWYHITVCKQMSIILDKNICGWNRSTWKLFKLHRNTWNHITTLK